MSASEKFSCEAEFRKFFNRAKLIEISQGKVAAFIFVINLFDLGGCENLLKKNYFVENLIEFPGH